MRILVFGLGALGTVYSCLMKNSGHYVAGIDQQAVIDVIGNHGVRVSGIWGEHTAYLDRLATNVAELADNDFDLIILSVKAYETAEVAEKLQTLITPGTYLMLAQNGYGNFEAAARYINESNIILGRVIFGAETISSGNSKVTVIADDVILGSPPDIISPEVLQELARNFSEAGIPTRYTDEIMKYMWGKIIYNSALNPLGAILEVNYGKLAEMTETRQLMDKIIEEIFDVLSSLGQPTLWPDAAAYKGAFYGQLIPSTRNHHASMLQDIQLGRRTEIDALNGAVVRLGEQLGIDTPVNKVISALVRAKEVF